MEYFITAVIIAMAGGILIAKYGLKRITIFEFEKGLKYHKGKFKKVLQPGEYWYLKYHTKTQKVDVRPRFVSITGQEVLSADSVTLKVSLAAKYEITDPNIAVNTVENHEGALYLELQLALREIIGTAPIDELLERRNEFSKKLMALADKKAEDLGLKLHSVNIKDIMFPGQLKQMFAQVVSARKQGLAALERARGETAALRNLANAARLVKDNPALMQLRLFQSLSESSGNTLVLGVPAHTNPLPINAKREDVPTTKQIQARDADAEGV
jgi:regulator of protease activity HflC (stomatin/prohibitin superfamily)